MQHYSLKTIGEMQRIFRANFINCLTGFKSPVLIGTVSSEGNENLAIFNNLVHLGADPALVGFVNRPREATPHTLANIESTRVYTINHIARSFVQLAHQTSAKYPEGVSEFLETGLTPQKLGECVAPFVAESPVKFSLQLKEIIPVQFNNTYFVIGAITDIYTNNTSIEEDGCLHLQQEEIVTSLGLNEYYTVNKITKMDYARP